MRIVRRVLYTTLALAFTLVGPHLFALGPELEITYYEGCGTLTYVGDAFRTCNGQWTYNGQQGGQWKEQWSFNCSTQTSSHTYYEWCNGSWVLRSAAQFGNCQCS